MKKLKTYVKIFQYGDKELAESKVNEFIKNNSVKATQSHVTTINNLLVFTFVVFHEVWEE